MKIENIDQSLVDFILKEGEDILTSVNMQKESKFPMHRGVSTYDHSLGVAYLALYISRKHHFKNIDDRSLIRGALLHDFFLYDWHVHDRSHKFHGFIHAKRALKNAEKEFNLTKIEKDIILKHMFPVNIAFPKYKESWIVDYADKVCATYEIRNRKAAMSVTRIKRGLILKHPNLKLA